jgi:hypothetical protein
MYYAYWEQKEEWNWGLILIVVAIIIYVYTGYNVSAALAETAAALSVTLGVTLATAQIIMAVAYLAALGVFGEDYVIFGQIALLAIGVATSGVTLGANAYTATTVLRVASIMNTYKMQHILEDSEQIANLTDVQEILKDEIREAVDDAYELLGYYYNLRKKQYIAHNLINIRKVDHFDAMPSAEYFQKVKKSISPRYSYRLQYKYT